MTPPRLNRQATIWRIAVSSDPEYLTPDPDSGAARVAWVPVGGYQPGSPQIPVRFWGERQDVLPSRSESVQQGLVVGRRQTRWRQRWRADIDSSMRVTIYGDADEDFNIIGGPADYGPRKSYIELLLERVSS